MKAVEVMKAKLSHVSQALEEWLACQKKWECLEPLFAQYEVQRQLSSQTTKFRVIDRRWRSKTSSIPQTYNV